MAMLWAVTKRVMGSCFQALKSALIAMGIEKFMGILKQLILDHVIKHVRNSLLGKVLLYYLQKMGELMGNIWEVMKRNGGSASDAARAVRACIDSSR